MANIFPSCWFCGSDKIKKFKQSNEAGTFDVVECQTCWAMAQEKYWVNPATLEANEEQLAYLEPANELYLDMKKVLLKHRQIKAQDSPVMCCNYYDLKVFMWVGDCGNKQREKPSVSCKRCERTIFVDESPEAA